MFCNMSSSGIQVFFLILAWNKCFDVTMESDKSLSKIQISFIALLLLQRCNLLDSFNVNN